MPVFKVTICTDNHAFKEAPFQVELARILRELVDWLERGHYIYKPLRDINGNRVGTAEYTD